jgi:hypothetical protein
MPQENSQNFFKDDETSYLPKPPKSKAERMVARAANDNNKKQSQDNVIQGKFTQANNDTISEKANEQRAQANAYFSNSKNPTDPENILGKKPVNDNNPAAEEAKKNEIYEKDRVKKGNKTNSMYDDYNRANAMYGAANDNQQNESREKIAAIRKVFAEEKINLSEDEAQRLLDSGFKVPFPAFMFMFAVCKDISDVFISVISVGLSGAGVATSATAVGAPVGIPLTGVGAAIVMINSFIITPIYLIIFNIWLRNYGQDKSNFKAATKLNSKIIKRMAPKIIANKIIEFLPYINMLPMNPVNVMIVVNLHKKLARKSKAAVA